MKGINIILYSIDSINIVIVLLKLEHFHFLAKLRYPKENYRVQ